MKIYIDTDTSELTFTENQITKKINLYSKEAFEIISYQWLKTSWNQKYSYTFTWMGRPIIQHPEDLLRLQEVIYTLKPDVIIETGVAHGGSLILYASLLKAMGKNGHVVGIDIEIRPHNRNALENHELASIITLIEGNSIAEDIVNKVASKIQPGQTVLIILDSDHSYAHVMAELDAYKHLVTIGSYIISTDGIMREVFDVPRGSLTWKSDNPATAAEDFIKLNPQFSIETPKWLFNESELSKNITTWPSSWIKRNS